VIVSFWVEGKRTIVGDREDDTQIEMILYSRTNINRWSKDKRDMECYYCKKMSHTSWNYRSQSNNILKGKFKDIVHVTNETIVEDRLDADSGHEFTEEREFYAF